MWSVNIHTLPIFRWYETPEVGAMKKETEGIPEGVFLLPHRIGCPLPIVSYKTAVLYPLFSREVDSASLFGSS